MKKQNMRKLITQLDKGVLWLGPVSVLAFVVLLTVMYGWVGDVVPTTGEAPETPEVNLAAQVQVPVSITGQQPTGGQLVNGGPQFPAGIGGGQIQLINNPTFPAGIGNGQIQLINNPTFSAGIGNGQNGQIQLINQAMQGQGPYMGLSFTDLTVAVAKELNMEPGSELYVKAVVAGSPAETAGIKMGDVLLECDHQKVTMQDQVGAILKTKKAGDVIKLVVNRAGRTQSFHVKLQNAPNGLVQAAAIQNPNWMGADIQDIDAVMKLQFNLPEKTGVIVSHITPQSPAQMAGIKSGDVISRFGGTRIRDVKQLQSLILGAQPGSQVQLTVFRGGQYLTLPLVLGQQAPVAPKVPFLGPADVAIEGAWIGMDVAELSPNDVKSLGLPAGTTGVLVADVEGPPASMVGFQVNDVITAVNGTQTPDMKSFATATQKQTGAVVDVVRGEKHLFVSVPPPGFTQQGTKINTAMDNKFKQVAAAMPINGYLAILTVGPDMNAAIAPNMANAPYLVIVDVLNDSYAVTNPVNQMTIADAARQYNIKALICGNIPGQTAQSLSAAGVVVYSGVVGTAMDAIGLYQSNSLLAMQ
jgi:S1-C subfamily serine protease/predicted Fe-Mo cluster-binding NifX family protein